mgnify:CR=1 FL=1
MSKIYSYDIDKRINEAFDAGKSLGEFIVSEHGRYGHASSYFKLLYIGETWRKLEDDRAVAYALATANGD